jgi:hypothetical protein
MSKREEIAPKGDKRYIRRDDRGRHQTLGRGRRVAVGRCAP